MRRNGLAAAGLAAVVWLAAAGPAARADLVVNGGFETGGFSGWTVTTAASGSNLGQTSGGYQHTGNLAAVFAAVGGQPDFLSQSLATTPGQQYALSFWLRNDNFGFTPSNGFTAEVGGGTLLSLSLTNSPDFAYTQYSYTFTASSASTLLRFGGYNKPGGYLLDDVSVNAVSAVPEPSAVGMGLAGLGLLVGGLGRLRRLAGGV